MVKVKKKPAKVFVDDKLKPSAEYVASLKKIEETEKKAKLEVWSAVCVRI